MNRRESILAIVAIGAGAGPIASLAQQQSKVWRVGFLSLQHRLDSNISQYTDAFLRGMREHGYVEGKNLAVDWRFAEGNAERMPSMAAELVDLKVDVIVAQASPGISAAKKATSTIPIVKAATGDPVGSGFVKSWRGPEGTSLGFRIWVAISVPNYSTCCSP